jgi:chorismate synthase
VRYISSGHSHGEKISIIFEGVPANLEIDINDINSELSRRQSGYGRGGRMKIEHDEVKFTGGVIFSKTTGAPIAMEVINRDYNNHQTYMSPFDYDLENYKAVKVPRPGHADLVGLMKYEQNDTRVVFERASARETVSRVCVGAICKQILKQMDINVYSYVVNIGGVEVTHLDLKYINESPVRMPSLVKTKEAIELIDQVKLNKDTIGGICVVVAENIPAGIGSYVSHETKLDAKIAANIISIQACKGVEFGQGFALSNHLGSEVHDEIIYDHGFSRTSNNYGGFEGGMTTGMPLVIRAVFKPIPTLMQPLKSVNIDSKEVSPSHIERSDVCVIPAASVICEHVLNYEITKAICEQFTSDTMKQLVTALNDYRDYLKRF